MDIETIITAPTLEKLIPRNYPRRVTWLTAIRLAYLFGEEEKLQEYAGILQSGELDEYDIDESNDELVHNFIAYSENNFAGHATERHVGTPETLVNRYQEYRNYCRKCGKFLEPKTLTCFSSEDDIAIVIKAMVTDDSQFQALQEQLATGSNAELSRYSDYGSVICKVPPIRGYAYKFEADTDLTNEPNITEREFRRAAVILRKDRRGKVYLLTCYPYP